MNNPIIPNSPVEQEYVIPHYIPHRKMFAQQKYLSIEEKHRMAMFDIGNTRFGKDGRTYVSVDADGEYQSCFVSQYSRIIDKNIEPGVRGICQALHQKNYLTFGSCQGHADSKLRWIGLVFNTKDQKEEFIKNVDNLGLEIYWYDNHINTMERPKKSLPWYADGLILHIVWDNPMLEKQTTSTRRDFPYTDNDLTKFWNIQMCRRYDHYESVILTIGKRVVESNCLKQFYSHFTYDEKRIDRITKQFEEKINLLPSYYG